MTPSYQPTHSPSPILLTRIGGNPPGMRTTQTKNTTLMPTTNQEPTLVQNTRL